jgi:hypothetical protein
MKNGKVIVQFEVPIKQGNTTSADVHARFDKVLQDWTEYINDKLTNNTFFDKVKVAETKIEGAKDGNQLELNLKNH